MRIIEGEIKRFWQEHVEIKLDSGVKLIVEISNPMMWLHTGDYAQFKVGYLERIIWGVRSKPRKLETDEQWKWHLEHNKLFA